MNNIIMLIFYYLGGTVVVVGAGIIIQLFRQNSLKDNSSRKQMKLKNERDP